jgi:hypothetical protein
MVNLGVSNNREGRIYTPWKQNKKKWKRNKALLISI